MNKIVSFKYQYSHPISLDDTYIGCCSIGELTPIGISWECNGTVYGRINENGLCATLLQYHNIIGVVESPYKKGNYNPAYILDNANQIIWNVSDLFLATYGNKYYGGVGLHFMDVIVENETLCFIINISNCDFRFSINLETGEIGRLVETR